MKLGIAHFTDVHFTTKTNIDNKLASCINALKNDFYGVEAIYFILSGDITFSGKKAEFDLAKSFFDKIKQLLEMQYTIIKIKMVIVPGNHDCNILEHDSQLRRNSIEKMNYATLGTDNSVIDICLSVQKDFWDFYAKYNPTPQDKLFYQVCDNINNHSICFHCINTSWLSQKNETVGGLFFPTKRFDSYNNDDCYLNIGVWHHPYNWFNPSTAENNKKELQQFTERIASVHFLGHEHENEFYSNQNMNTGNKINLLSGKVFNEDANPNNSGFETMIIDLDKRTGELKKYLWDKDKTFYNSKTPLQLSFTKDIYKKFQINEQFLNSLDEIKIPLVIGNNKAIRLSDIFVFPDLDVINSDLKVLDNYYESEHLLSGKYGNCMIVGEDQIGKTSLLCLIYLKKYHEGVYPLMLTGKDIKDFDFNKLIRKAFKNQYNDADEHFEAYLQLDKFKKILLIDDYHTCKFNISTGYTMFKEAMSKFDIVIATIDSTHSMLPILQSEFKEIGFYKIKPLGYSLRNSLVERYLYLKGNSQDINDSLDILKETFDKVQNVLGDKLMPTYPIYILSILQALDYNSLRQNETSFGYCYQTLIHYSLHKASVKNEDIDTYFNFLRYPSRKVGI